MIVIKIDNTLQSFYNEMTRLKSEHPNLSFISYIDGEIGFRVILYNSLVYQFATKQRELNNFIVGLCFIGNTFYLKHYCDVVLEVQDIAFQWESFDTSSPEQLSQRNHFPTVDPYAGNNGSHPFYNTGYYNHQYEQILLDMNLSNIFFTYHCASAWHTSGELNRYQTSMDIVDLDIGKINNNYYKIFDKDLLEQIKILHNDKHINGAMYRIMSFNKFKKQLVKNDNIVVWIRKTNKYPERNMPEEIYLTLFNYCISNKKHLHIFLDLEKVTVPINEYLHVYDFRKNNQPLFDEFVKICNKSYIFIGCDSGSSWIAAHYTKVNCLIYNDQWWYADIIYPQPIFKSKEELINTLNSKYISSNKLLE